MTPPPEERRRAGPRYATLVGLAFLALIVIAAVSSIGEEDAGILGTDQLLVGERVPEFAVPELLGSQEGDANVFQDDCETDETPCPEGERRTPACEVDLSEVIRVCDFFDRPLAISFWFDRSADCLPTQDAFDRVARRFEGRVGFLSIDIRDDRDDAREIVTERGWSVPVGWDADGAVASLYRVGVCPTVAFVLPGGVLSGARIGSEELSEEQIADEVRALLRDSRRREADGDER